MLVMKIASATVFIERGSVNGDNGFMYYKSMIQVGFTSLTFVQFNGKSNYNGMAFQSLEIHCL